MLIEQQVLAYRNVGQRFDCGSKLGYRRRPLILVDAIRTLVPLFQTI